MPLRRTLVSLLSVLAIAAAAGAALAQARWATYANARFGTTAEYPEDLFTRRDSPPENGDGQSFRTGDDRAQLSIYGHYNVEDDTPANYVQKYVDAEGVTYRSVTQSFYVVSGQRDGNIFYERCNFRQTGDDVVDCFTLTYPAQDKAAWDPIVGRISRSLRPGRGSAP